MAELSVDIVARYNEVQRQTQQLAQGFDRVEKEAKQAGSAAQVAGRQIASVGKSAIVADAQLQKLNTRGRNTTAIFTSVGQAVSDFAVAGILGAGNNIEFLAAQIGLGGPLILAVSAATTALFLFGDDIAEVIVGASVDFDKLQENVKGVADELVRVRDGIKVTFEGTADELEKDAERVGKIIDGLEARRIELVQLLGRQQISNRSGITTFAAPNQEAIRLQTQLEQVNTVLARQKGIFESITGSVEEQRLLEQVIADLAGTTLERKEEEAKKEQEKLTQLDRAIEANSRLKEQLESLRNIENSRLGALLQENKALQEQIRTVQRLNDLRAQGLIGQSLQGLSAQGLQSEGIVTPLDDLIEQINKDDRKKRGQQLKARTLDPALVKEMEDDVKNESDARLQALRDIVSGADLSAEAFDRAGISARFFFNETVDGAILASGILSDAAGTFQQAFSTAYEASGEKAKIFFALAKATGIAQATISTYEGVNKALATLPPPFSFITAAAIAAAGIANVAKIASTQPGKSGGAPSIPSGGRSTRQPGQGGVRIVDNSPRFGPGGIGSGISVGSIASDRAGLVPAPDPRQGRDSRFRRQFESGFQPQAPFAGFFDAMKFEFMLSGENLVASNRRTTQRQSRTRAVNSRSSLSTRG